MFHGIRKNLFYQTIANFTKCTRKEIKRLYSSSLAIQEKKVAIEKYQINYLKVGNGPHHVLCTPGSLGSIWTDFKYQVENFDKEKFTMVFWDPPGFGKSIPPERKFSENFYNDDVQISYELMKALNIPRYSLLGWSYGSVISMVHAAIQPDKVQKLVIWGANSFILPKEVAYYKEIKDTTLWSTSMKQPMIDLYGEERFASYWTQWVDSIDQNMERAGGDYCSKMLPDIKCPTFILHGERDPIIDGIHFSYLQTHIKNTTSHLYPDGKHNIHIRYHEDFNRRVQEFLLL